MINFPPHFIHQVKDRCIISEVIRPFVELKPKGPGEFLGLCPFHNEKTPSFSVSDRKGFYHCFGCNASGDAIAFLMEQQGMSFADSITHLAQTLGIPLPEAKPLTQEQKKKVDYQTSLYDVMQLAQDFFIQNLPTQAKEYLLKRHFDQHIIHHFGIGYASPNNHALVDFLTSKKVSTKQMIDCGLLIAKDNSNPYARFRDRITFPIHDAKGQVVAFGGRILGDGQPKYLNSPETSIFKKGELLYNYHRASKAAFKADQLIITEGYMDTIALHRAGFPQTVASLGTAITPSQLQLMWKTCKRPTICLDGDEAGLRAMERIANIAIEHLKPGYTLMFAHLPQGCDPDDVISTYGSQAMHDILRAAQPLSEMIWNCELCKQNTSIPEYRADLETRLQQLVEKIPDTTVANHYRQFFKSQLWNIQKKHFHKSQTTHHLGSNQDTLDQINMDTMDGCQLYLSALTMWAPWILDDEEIYDQWINIDFNSNMLDNIRTIILESRDSDGKCSPEALVSAIEQGGGTEQLQVFNRLKKHGFFERISTETEVAQTSWKYMYLRHHLVSLKSEYQALLGQMTDEAIERAVHLQKDICELEQSINQYEVAIS